MKRHRQRNPGGATSSYRLTWTHIPEWPQLSREERHAAYQRTARNEGATFVECLERLEKSVATTHPLGLLSSFSTYFLTSLTHKHEIADGVEMVQAHGEMLQAIALRHQWDDFEFREHPSQAMQEVGLDLANAARAFSGRRVGNFSLGETPSELAQAFVIEFVRVGTQLSRNWGYSYQTFDVARELFAPLGGYMKANCGATAGEILDLWTALTKQVESQLNLVVEAVRRERATESPDLFVTRVCRSLGVAAEQMALLRETVRHSAKGPDARAATQFICLDRILPMVHMLSWSDVRRACPESVSDEALARLMGGWSLSFGEIANCDLKTCFLDNPVWKRPIVSLDSLMWYLPFPHLLFSFCWDLLSSAHSVNEQEVQRYRKRRGSYLEQAIASVFRGAFPMATVLVGNHFRDPTSAKLYQNDVLVRIDSVVIVIEAKSGGMHPSARRGADLRLTQVIKDLIVEPAIQSRRLEAALRAEHETFSFFDTDGGKRDFDMRGVETIVSWSVTLDNVADLSAVQSELDKSGWIPSDVMLPPSMSLSDLQNLFELLDGHCPKLHYLCRRAQWARTAKYVGDELDLLAVYFSTLFEIGNAESDGTRLLAYGAARVFDSYFLEREQGHRVRKPKLPLTRWWFNLISCLDQRRPEGWSQIGLDLLSVSPSDQEHFGELMKDARRNVLQGTAPLKDTVLFVSGSSRKVAIVGVAYMDRTREERNDRLAKAARQVAFPDGSLPKRVVVIGCDPRIQGIPYSVVALVGFDAEAPVILEM